MCVRWKLRWLVLVPTFSFSVLVAYLSLSFSFSLCSLSYVRVCRPAPTGPMDSIGVHWIACMAAVAPHAASNTRSGLHLQVNDACWHVRRSPEWAAVVKYCTNFIPFIWLFAEEVQWAPDQQLSQAVTSRSRKNWMSAFAPCIPLCSTHIHGLLNKRFASVASWDIYVHSGGYVLPSGTPHHPLSSNHESSIWDMRGRNAVPDILLIDQDQYNLLVVLLVGKLYLIVNSYT